MAEIGTFVVQEVLKRIVKYGAEQIVVAWELENEVSLLKDKLHDADTILEDINRKKSHPGNSVKRWVEKLEDIVHEADDLLDELVYEHLRRTVEHTEKFSKVSDSISSSINSFLFRRKMAKKIKNITDTLNQHYCAASAFGLVGVETVTEIELALNQIRETTSILDFQVEGREAEVLELLKLAIDSTNEHHMSVISIVGMGGLGKTTLAKMIFNHREIEGHFDKTIWVCVSKPFIVTKILEKIFQGLTKTCSGLESNKEALLGRLRKEMQDKNYFLVLDDVWDNEKHLWDELRGCLKHIAGKPGNTIMVTTRNEEVATMVEPISIYRLKKLSNDQCWALFKESANANQLPMNSKLEIMKKELVRKMGGVPLVAKVLGGAVKFEETELEEEDHEISWMTKVESIVRNISLEDKDFVLSILKLSVDSLPNPVLKQCVAYCSNFSQDYDFQKDDLIKMWIAQGFIQPGQGRDKNLLMEDIGEQYFNFLLSRSIFQDVTRDANKRIVGFKMHDLMHDIACAISSHQNVESNPNNLSGKSVRKLRTLICNDEVINYLNQNDIVCLRVLKVIFQSHTDLWIPIDKLIHLRYLDISECSINKLLLESLSLLYNLQTLKLGQSGLPKNLRKLVNLRHLEFKMFGDTAMPSDMGNLIHLQSLSGFLVGFEKGCKIEELGPLKNLKGKLTLTNLWRVQNKDEAMAAKLVEKKNLRHLNLWFFETDKRGEDDEDGIVQVLEGLQPHKNLQSLEILGFRGKVLPTGIFVENLVKIRLGHFERCEVLPMLGQLPNLKELEIMYMESVRSIGNEFYGVDSSHQNSVAFPQLKKLSIYEMMNLEQWDEATVVLESNLFGCLKEVRIRRCNPLAKLPSGLEGCHSLEYLSIRGCFNLMLNVQNLHKLYHLEIDGLKRLPKGMDGLTRLKELKIGGCMQNYEFSSVIHLASQLVELELSGRYGSVDTQLPQQLQHLTNLQVLKITQFDCIEALPEWIGNLISLKTLKCSYCFKLKELPSREAILRLTKLENLDIFECPKLLVGEGDQERAKLSHLPSKCVHKSE